MSEQPDIEDMISISEAARIRNVSHGAIQDLIKREKLSSFNVGGKAYIEPKRSGKFSA